MGIDVMSEPVNRGHKCVLGVRGVLESLKSVEARRHSGQGNHGPAQQARAFCFPQQGFSPLRHQHEAEERHHRKVARLRMVLHRHEEYVAGHGQHRGSKHRVEGELPAPPARCSNKFRKRSLSLLCSP